jgi:hypothetical protein
MRYDEMIMNEEPGRMWVEATVACFKVLSWHFPIEIVDKTLGGIPFAITVLLELVINILPLLFRTVHSRNICK